MLPFTVPREVARTGPSNSEGDYSEAGLFSNNECTIISHNLVVLYAPQFPKKFFLKLGANCRTACLGRIWLPISAGKTDVKATNWTFKKNQDTKPKQVDLCRRHTDKRPMVLLSWACSRLQCPAKNQDTKPEQIDLCRLDTDERPMVLLNWAVDNRIL